MKQVDYRVMTMDDDYKTHHPHCLECGREMVYGRTDRKFCSSVCKNKYHNRPEAAQRNLKRRIQHILEKNYRILATFLNSGITSISIQNLLVMGFNPMYFTSCIRQNRGLVCMCFDIKYTQTPNKIYQMEYVQELRKNSPDV